MSEANDHEKMRKEFREVTDDGCYELQFALDRLTEKIDVRFGINAKRDTPEYARLAGSIDSLRNAYIGAFDAWLENNR